MFDPHRVRQHSFVEIDHEIFSAFILFLLLIQEGQFEGWAQDCSNSNIFLKPLFRGNFDSFVNNANLGAIAHMSSGT